MGTQVTLGSGTVASAGTLKLQTNGTTDAVTIDASQNVGIGTGSPQNLLNVVKNSLYTSPAANAGLALQSDSGVTYTSGLHFGTDKATAISYIQSDSSASYTAVPLALNPLGGNVGIGTSSPATKFVVQGGSAHIDRGVSGGASQLLQTYGASSGGNFGQISNTGTRWSLGYGSSQSTVGTEVVSWDSSGNLLVGTTSPVRSGDRFSVAGTGAQVMTITNSTNTSGFSTYSSILQQNGNNTNTYHFWGNTNTVGNWYLYGNGTMSFSSDSRLKKNIQTARNGYSEDLCKLRVVKYNWKNDEDGTPQELGLIAQEVEQVFPGLVQDDLNPVEEGGMTFKQLKASVLPFMLLKAIQEQQALITSLTERLTALENK